jgi:hypothetical protein
LSMTPINADGTGGADGETITYPLSASMRAAYDGLYASCKASLEQTNDPQTVEELTGIQLELGGVIGADDDAHMAGDTADFSDLKKKINDTNDALKNVQDHMAEVAKKIGVVGNVVSGITTVLSFFPAI